MTLAERLQRPGHIPASGSTPELAAGVWVIGYGDEPFPDRLFPAGHGRA
jgi:hypothetical protein